MRRKIRIFKETYTGHIFVNVNGYDVQRFDDMQKAMQFATDHFYCECMSYAPNSETETQVEISE